MRKQEGISAVVLAGSPDDRALWKYRGVSLLNIALRALSSAGIYDVVVIGTRAVVARAGERTNFLLGPGSFDANLMLGLNNIENNEAIVITSDQPLINGAVLRNFIDSCRANDELQIGYPVILAAECEMHLPGMERTKMTLREGCFTGGSVLYVSDRSELIENQETIALLYRARKSKKELAKFLGYGVAFRYLLAKYWPWLLSIRSLESVASRKLGAAVRHVRAPYQLGADADTREQLDQFEELV